MESSKIHTLKEISKVAQQLRKDNKIIVTCNGIFDILHIGHIKFLQHAKQKGDFLIVGLNSDKSVKANKKPNRPINNQKNRAALLSALECVDFVVIFDEKDPRHLLSLIKPNIHVNGKEYTSNCIEAGVVKINGGKIHLFGNYRGFSTTKLLQTISMKH